MAAKQNKSYTTQHEITWIKGLGTHKLPFGLAGNQVKLLKLYLSAAHTRVNWKEDGIDREEVLKFARALLDMAMAQQATERCPECGQKISPLWDQLAES